MVQIKNEFVSYAPANSALAQFQFCFATRTPNNFFAFLFSSIGSLAGSFCNYIDFDTQIVLHNMAKSKRRSTRIVSAGAAAALLGGGPASVEAARLQGKGSQALSFSWASFSLPSAASMPLGFKLARHHSARARN